MSKDDSFEALEKQLAKDALEKALKDLHSEIHKEIERNKKSFSDEIQKTLIGFKENLEKNVSKEIDSKLSVLFTKHFQNTSSEVKSSFDQMFTPVLKEAKKDMQQLQTQGEKTLQSWGKMMSQYASLWNKPFILMFFSCVFTGVIASFFLSYFLGKADRSARQYCESTLQLYIENYSEMKKRLETMEARDPAAGTKKKP
ncbi:MAG: hypothetical protein K2W92_07600 [Alphaproteobacteria bacterium]|nr:hypothetical protein [Alphaproteobacteria bacterium]